MSAYVVFIGIRTRDPAELAQYTAQAPAFVAGTLWSGSPILEHARCWKGSEGKRLRHRPRDDAFHQSQAPRNAIVGFAM